MTTKTKKRTKQEEAEAPTDTTEQQTNGAAEVSNAGNGTAQPGLSRDEQWQGACKYAFNSRNPSDWALLQEELRNESHVPFLDDQRMMVAAVELVGGMAETGVSRWDWLPAPSDADLAATATWVAQRLAARRSEQDAVAHGRRLRQKQARAFGQPSAGTGTGRPVHLQRTKHSLDELAKRLEFVMAQPGFEPQWLDHKSPHYINNHDGGISNKQIPIMAGEITGDRSWRWFDENWKIVTDWLNERKAAA